MGGAWESPGPAERAEGPFLGQNHPSLPACVCFGDGSKQPDLLKKNKIIYFQWLIMLHETFSASVCRRQGEEDSFITETYVPRAWKWFQCVGSTPEGETQTVGTGRHSGASASLPAPPACTPLPYPQPPCLHPLLAPPASLPAPPACNPSFPACTPCLPPPACVPSIPACTPCLHALPARGSPLLPTLS